MKYILIVALLLTGCAITKQYTYELWEISEEKTSVIKSWSFVDPIRIIGIRAECWYYIGFYMAAAPDNDYICMFKKETYEEKK